MFEVGDLVRYKPSGTYRGRYNPLKKFGIVVAVHNGELESLWGTKQGLIIVRWMPWNNEEKVVEVCLEPLRKTS